VSAAGAGADSSLFPFIKVRDAHPDDLDLIVEFNERLALETEAKTLDRIVLTRGVQAALNDPDRLKYWVAESTAMTLPRDRCVVGQAAVTREWSDWRHGWLWWFQSVYVLPEARRQGVFRALHTAIRKAARDARDVVGLRLYVEERNARAHATYQMLGLSPGGYHVYEEIWPDRFGGGITEDSSAS
jgi:GNAT superfamily N-acetyltransferase